MPSTTGRLLIGGLTAAMIAAATPFAAAATFIVNSVDDDDDAACDAAPGDCTLREAIDAANAAAGRDTIEFDPVAFAIGDPGTITVASALPSLDDPAGAVVDGRGAGVVLDGSGLGVGNGLVFESGLGVPLSNVEVYDISIVKFPERGLVVCGGQADACEDELSKVRIDRVVATGNTSTGILVRGAPVDDVRVMDSVASANDGNGIWVTSIDGHPLTKVRVERCTAAGNDGNGLELNASANNVGTKVTDCVAVRNSSDGVKVNAGADIVNPKVTDVTVNGNEGDGLDINAGDAVIGVKIKGAYATANDDSGIRVNTGDDLVSGTKISSSWVAASGAGGGSRDGILVQGATIVGLKVSKTASVGNSSNGLRINGNNVTGVSNAKLSNLMLSDNGMSGLLLEGSDNKVNKVVADGNGLHGVDLRTDGPAGSNKVGNVRANANGTNGIRVAADNTNNKISKNEAYGNQADDLNDENVGCANNQWTKNEFRWANDPCTE